MQNVLLIIFGVISILALYTGFRVWQTEKRHGPTGEFRTVDGVLLHFHRRMPSSVPQGLPPLVFIHGASGNALDPMIAFLDHFDDAYDLIFVDRPGHGHSERKAAKHSDPMQQAQSISALLGALGISKYIVVGHSRVAALPVVGFLFSWTITLPVAERLANASIQGVFSPDAAPVDYGEEVKLPLLFRPSSFRANAQDVANLNVRLAEQSRRYSEIVQPAVVITGTKDSVVWPSIHSDGLMRDLQDARMVVLEGAGHMPHHSHGAQISKEIKTLMMSLRSERPPN
ncbi:alpha/beta fold hydrolase [Roseibium algae]|uniref:Alpha/beta hydrolase n=1 Tax=Roseibium algae TaxID=3123038 RepID=A0ABU8TG51_9HYPH